MKYLIIEKSKHDNFYDVLSKKNHEQLGMIFFYKKWKKWCFEPYSETVYDSVCLGEIMNYMEKLK